MKTQLLTATVIALIPLAGVAADTAGAATFDALDANKDGRISLPEASADPQLVEGFSKADKNSDGYLDKPEYDSRTPPQKK